MARQLRQPRKRNPERNQEKLEKMPLIESNIFKSKSGNYVVHRTVITDIRPTSYYEKMMGTDVDESEISERGARDRHGFKLFRL